MHRALSPSPMPSAPCPPRTAARPGQKPGLRDWFDLAKRAFASWLDGYAPSMGAALSYYTVFSLGPVMLLVISIAGLVFGEEAARGEIYAQLQGMLGSQRRAGGAGPARKARSRRAERLPAALFGVGRAVRRRDHGLRRAAGRARPHLARAAAAARPGLWSLLRSAAAVVRHDPGHRLPARSSRWPSARRSARASSRWWDPESAELLPPSAGRATDVGPEPRCW
ncbi:MAG: hypothetical protein MZW92_74890 [Comamonadaceae bacterium]|nr:hypothetical protein [Comamonadaceae bacterium]